MFQELDDPDFHKRNAASVTIESLPPEAIPLIEKAIREGSISPEASGRLEAKLPALRRNAAAAIFQRQIDQAVQWNRDTFLADYEHSGRANPRWDAAARMIITISTRSRANQILAPSASRRLNEAIQQAVDQGCDDPTVRFLIERRHDEIGDATQAELVERLTPVSEAVLASNCHPYFKLWALTARAELKMGAEQDQFSTASSRAILHDLDRALELLPSAASDPTLPQSHIVDACTWLLWDYGRALKDSGASVRKVIPAMGRVVHGGEGSALVLREQGEYLLAVGRADQKLRVTFNGVEAAVKAYEQRIAATLASANDSLVRSWELDRADPMTPALLVLWADASGAPVDQMEMWFQRAMAIDPGNASACANKLNFLLHHSDFDSALAFGRECVATGNWKSRLPFILVDAHVLHTATEGEAYLTQDAAWQDIHNVYDSYLQRFPAAVTDRSYYAWIACRAGKWKEANSIFQQLGDEAVPEKFGGAANMEYFQRKAAKRAAGG